MAIYITGDTHGGIDISKLNSKSRKAKGINLTNKDYIIICGDFGFPFTPNDIEKYEHHKGEYWYWINWLSKLPCTILWVDGNHDNHEWWTEQKKTQKFGGMAQISPHASNVIHLLRGYVYTINGKKFFTMGGAESIDKLYRTEHISWWKDEMPSKKEYNRAIMNLQKHNMTVDYVISHDCGSSYINKMYSYHTTNELTSFFDRLEFDFGLKFKHWYFGHHHIDKTLDSKHTCLYQQIVEIGKIIN